LPGLRGAVLQAFGRATPVTFWCHLTHDTTIRPFDVPTYIATLQQTHSAPGVKQQLAAVRMLFDWLIIGQVAPSNPASAVRGPTHVVKTGTTPVLEGKEWRRPLIATLTYGFARIGAALKMRVEDLPIEGLWLADPAARERRQAALNAVPSRACRGAARLHRSHRHRRGQEGISVPHVARPHGHGVVGSFVGVVAAVALKVGSTLPSAIRGMTSSTWG
jgi:hypothetical protein